MLHTHVKATDTQEESLLLKILKGLTTVIGFIFKSIFQIVGFLLSLIAKGFMIFVDAAENFGSPNQSRNY